MKDLPEQSETINQKASRYRWMAELLITITPDWEWTNRLLKKKVGEYIKKEFPPTTLAGEMAHRCIDQNKAVFDRDAMAHINDKAPKVLAKMMRDVPEIVAMKPGNAYDWNTRFYPDLNEIQKDRSKIAEDLRIILGHVKVLRLKDGSFVVKDYFDMANPRDSMHPINPNYWPEPESANTLLKAALRAHDTGQTTLRNLYLGRMFCPEPALPGPGEYSIPVEIHLSSDEVVTPVLPLRVNEGAVVKKR